MPTIWYLNDLKRRESKVKYRSHLITSKMYLENNSKRKYLYIGIRYSSKLAPSIIWSSRSYSFQARTNYQRCQQSHKSFRSPKPPKEIIGFKDERTLHQKWSLRPNWTDIRKNSICHDSSGSVSVLTRAFQMHRLRLPITVNLWCT